MLNTCCIISEPRNEVCGHGRPMGGVVIMQHLRPLERGWRYTHKRFHLVLWRAKRTDSSPAHRRDMHCPEGQTALYCSSLLTFVDIKHNSYLIIHEFHNFSLQTLQHICCSTYPFIHSLLIARGLSFKGFASDSTYFSSAFVFRFLHYILMFQLRVANYPSAFPLHAKLTYCIA